MWGRVMLHRDDRKAACFRKTGGMEIRMQVASDRLRRHVEDAEEMADRALVETDHRRVVEVADMLRDKGLAPARDRHGRLQMGADADHGGPIPRRDRSARERSRAKVGHRRGRRR